MFCLKRMSLLNLVAGGLVLGLAVMPSPLHAETVLRVGITASDIPLTSGNPDQGAEGMVSVGYNLYDALINWDMTRGDRIAGLRPGLATSWKIDPADNKKWIFALRSGVKFHDGSDFDADAVIWNFEKLLNSNSPQFDPKQAGQVRGRIPSVVGFRKIDKQTVELETNTPDAFLPYQLTWLLFSSPAQFEKVGRNWDKFAADPSGTGPWKFVKLVPRERLEMTKNTGYWDATRVPKIDKITIIPLPEASTRTAALRAGQVDWIELPATDTIPSLKQAGFNIVSNSYPHLWMYHFSLIDDSPVKDRRVRQALNLAVNRDGLKVLLGGFAQPAKGLLPESSPWFGKPQFEVKYDPAAAKKLLAEAGYTAANPLSVKVLMSASGSGQMQPQPMNEFIQQNLADVGVKLELEAVDWMTLLTRWRGGAKLPLNKSFAALQTNMITTDPFSAFIRIADSRLTAPKGVNYGEYINPEMDRLLDKARVTFDSTELDKILGEIHSKIVDDALFLFVVHDVNPRALSPRVKNFVQAQSWFQDFTPVTLQ